MNSYQLEELIKNIQAMIKCPSCGNSYKKENINFLGQLGEAVLVQLNCYACKMPVMATIVVSGTNRGAPNLKDLERYSQDMPKLFSEMNNRGIKRGGANEKITSDEIIDMHGFLEDFNGDFEKEFK